jgi:hypothetical protein
LPHNIQFLGNSIVGSQQQPMTADHLDQSTALLNSVQQQKTAIDIIQKALEAIAVVNQQQPKLANALGVSPPPQAPPSLLGTNPTANGLTSNLYVHLQQNGVALNQHQQQTSNILQQQQNAQLEQQLVRKNIRRINLSKRVHIGKIIKWFKVGLS